MALMNRRSYKVVGLGGTFDRFHAGHQALLELASNLGLKLEIGITSDAFASQKDAGVEPFSVRKLYVDQWCRKHKVWANIFPLTDPYGPLLDKTPIQAIIVSPETAPIAQQANNLREKLKLRPLPLHQVAWALDQGGQPIHSTRIRNGEISRQGVVYAQLFTQDFILTPDQRKFFHAPLEKPVSTEDLTKLLVGARPVVYYVGDSVLETALTEKWPISIGVFDQRRQRQDVVSSVIDGLAPTVAVANPAGVITLALVNALQIAIKKRALSLIKVEGEEDLAAVALILLAPLGTKVVYGQPDKGIVVLTISEKLKTQVYDTLSQ
jgi:pantetheine-phosphate adenylyltransferase